MSVRLIDEPHKLQSGYVLLFKLEIIYIMVRCHVVVASSTHLKYMILKKRLPRIELAIHINRH